VLRIIQELHDVGVAVGAFQQVCLRTPAHLADQAKGFYGHEGDDSVRAQRRESGTLG
jgi:hypothetical protein